MNHCRDCNSDYATPGTCNCFAPGGKRHLAPAEPFSPWVPAPLPWTPMPWPLTPGPIWWYSPTTTGGTVLTSTGWVTVNAALAGASNSRGM